MKTLAFLGLLLILTPVGAATVSPRTFTTLERAEKLLRQKDYAQAAQLLNQRLHQISGTGEKALLLRALASVHVAQNRYSQAIRLLEQALTTAALPEVQQRATLLTLGQLYLAQDQPRKAAQILERWLEASPSLRVEDHLLLAQVYARLARYPEALEHVNQAITSSDSPRDEWLQLRLGLNYRLKRYPAAIADLKTLIRRHPDKESYWQQLTGLYQLAGSDVTAAAVKELERLQGFLDREPEVLNLVALLRAIHAPYLAAERLQQALESGQVERNAQNLEHLAAAWIEAREFDRAIAALEQGAKLSSTGRLWFRLAQLNLERGRWRQAATAFEKALAKGVKEVGQAWLLLGDAYFELGRIDQARKAFRQASRFSKTRQSAGQWLKYLDRLQNT